MGANPNIFTNKENRRVVPPEEENFFVSAEEFKAIDTAFASKADQTDFNTLDGRVDTLETDLGTAETDIGNLETGKLDASALVTDFVAPDNVTVPSTLAVETKIDSEIVAQVPLYNTSQFGEDLDLKTSLKTPATAPQSGTVINFNSAVTQFGTFAEPLTGDFTFDLTTARNFAKSYVKIVSALVPSCITDLNTDGVSGTPIKLYGETFSTDVSNVNLLEFDYIDSEVINCTVKVYEDFAPSTIDPDLLIFLNYNENKDFSLDPSLLNESVYAADFVATVSLNAADATSVDLGGGNRALRTGNSGTGSLRARHTMAATVNAKSIFDAGTGFTIIVRLQKTDTNSVALISNQESTGTAGIRVQTNSSNQIITRINGVTRTVTTGIANGSYFFAAVTFDGTTVKVYTKSTAQSIAFSEVDSSVYASGQVLDLGGIDDVLRFDTPNVSGTNPQGLNHDVRKFWRRALSAVEVEAEATIIEP